MTLHAYAVNTLKSWTTPDSEQEQLRREFLQHLSENADGVWRSCVPDHVTASSLVIDPPAGRVALVLHGKVNVWLPTGGHCEPGDTSLADTALREAREETGIVGLRLANGNAPTSLDRHGAPCQPGVAEHHLDVQYFTIAPPESEPVVSEESHDVRWFDYDNLPSPLGDDVPGLVRLAAATFG